MIVAHTNRAAAEDGADMGRFFPATQVLAVLANHVNDVVEPFAKDGPRPFHDQLLPIH